MAQSWNDLVLSFAEVATKAPVTEQEEQAVGGLGMKTFIVQTFTSQWD